MNFALARRRAWVAACVLAILARLVVMLRFTGTNDVHYWQEYGASIAKVGLFETYRTLTQFNHPPLMGLWVLFAEKLGGSDGRWFSFTFKLLPLAGDLLAAWLLFRHTRPSATRDAGLKLACLFLWNPASFLVTAYHGNTDPMLASLCLCAALLAQAGNPLGAGLALGAAFNVKILALILLVPLAASARSTRELLRFTAAFAITCVPFVPALLAVGRPFVEHVFKYNSVPQPWGLSLFFDDVKAITYLGPYFASANEKFLPNARYLIIGSTALIALAMKVRGGQRWLEVAAFGLCTSLVLAPGFGYQYLAWPMPLFFAIDRGRAAKTSVVCGALLGLLYLDFWDGQYPGMSWMLAWPRIGVVLGAIAWVSLAGWSWRLGRSILTSRGAQGAVAVGPPGATPVATSA